MTSRHVTARHVTSRTSGSRFFSLVTICSSHFMSRSKTRVVDVAVVVSLVLLVVVVETLLPLRVCDVAVEAFGGAIVVVVCVPPLPPCPCPRRVVRVVGVCDVFVSGVGESAVVTVMPVALPPPPLAPAAVVAVVDGVGAGDRLLVLVAVTVLVSPPPSPSLPLQPTPSLGGSHREPGVCTEQHRSCSTPHATMLPPD
jgi:hypothetical protein